MNDPSSFADLVRAMRAAQKRYFKTRTQSDLQRSINLERQVDTQLEKIPPKPKAAEQLPLESSHEEA